MRSMLKFNKINDQYCKLFVCIRGSHCPVFHNIIMIYCVVMMVDQIVNLHDYLIILSGRPSMAKI